MHLLTSAVAGLVAIGDFARLVGASPVAVDRRDVTATSNQIREDPSPTIDAPAADNTWCCTGGCGWCSADPCFMDCVEKLFFVKCCEVKPADNTVFVSSIDDIDWEKYLGEEVPTAISSSEADAEFYKSLAEADMAKPAVTKRGPLEVTERQVIPRDDSRCTPVDGSASAPSSCCTGGCGWCSREVCSTESCSTECTKSRYFTTCCDHTQTRSSVFVNSVEEIPWEYLGDDFLADKFSAVASSDPVKRTPPAPTEVDALAAPAVGLSQKRHCCFLNCKVCMPDGCPEGGCSHRDKTFKSQCCKIDDPANIIFVDISLANSFESEDAIHQYLAQADLLNPVVSKRVALLPRDEPELSVKCSEDHKDDSTPKGLKPVDLSCDDPPRVGNPDRPQPAGHCCQGGCTFCSKDHGCDVTSGCVYPDKPQYDICCPYSESMVWVPGDYGA